MVRRMYLIPWCVRGAMVGWNTWPPSQSGAMRMGPHIHTWWNTSIVVDDIRVWIHGTTSKLLALLGNPKAFVKHLAINLKHWCCGSFCNNSTWWGRGAYRKKRRMIMMVSPAWTMVLLHFRCICNSQTAITRNRDSPINIVFFGGEHLERSHTIQPTFFSP
jgi:hypothetical protein